MTTTSKIKQHYNELPHDEREQFVMDYKEAQMELKAMQPDFRTWLTEQYHEQAHSYRVALEREVQHTKRIFGGKLPHDVRKVLLTSLREIPKPTLPKYPYGNDKENYLKIFKAVTPVNFHLIMREVVEQI